MTQAPRRWLADLAWLPGQGVVRDVLIEADGDRFTSVTPATPAAPDAPAATLLHGLTLPGFANAHSHAFHRALRSCTQAGRGTFWTWRERMYEVAARLDPERYHWLARAVFAEMALAGVSCVGEFHYLHHQPGGRPYADPNAMGRALLQAAAEAGLRITLLDTCYLAGGLAEEGLLPLAGPQLRFGDGDAVRWAERVTGLECDEHGMISAHAQIGAAIHSVRAVPRKQMHPVVAWAHRFGAPLHVHLSEQRAENEACQVVYGMSPTRLLYAEDVLGPRTTVVHATHVDDDDLELLGGCQTFACLCPTTERDLGDGLAPARALAAAGCSLTLGSDSHAVIDILEEARGVEYAERLARRARGHFTAEALLRAATMAGHTSLGWPDAGEIAPGAWANLVTVSLDSVRTAGAAGGLALEAAVFAASASDITDVVISGRDVVRGRGPSARAGRAGGAVPLDPRRPRLTAHSPRPASPAGTMVDMTDIPLVDLGGGAVMPMVGFGTWQLGGRRAYEAIRYALDVGYRHIDTATIYRNEHEAGQAIRDSGLDRGEVFVTTKLPPGNAGRARATLAESLRALGTDYVDLWLIHWPPRRSASVPVWREFLALRDEGRCRSVGVSNYDIAQIDELIAATGEPPAVNQIPWSPSQYDPDPAGRARRPRCGRRRVQPIEGHPAARPRPGRDRRPA